MIMNDSTSLPGRRDFTAGRAEIRLLLVVDQFEEAFTYVPHEKNLKAHFEKQRTAFFGNLPARSRSGWAVGSSSCSQFGPTSSAWTRPQYVSGSTKC